MSSSEPIKGHHNPFKKRRRKKRLRLEDITVIDHATLKRAVAAAALGNAMEWFDFGVYSYIAVVLGQVFFPGSSGTVQLLATFGAFAVAFLIRPVGGLFFGPLGDKVGRQKILAITMIMMAISTFCIGLIPSYSTIGVWAPILLLLARLVQGFSTGGEYGGAATFIAEYSPDRKRGFMGSWLEFGTTSGYLLGAAIVTVLSSALTHEQLLDWGWRIPFYVAGPLGLIGLYLRMKLEETPAFQEQAEQAEQQQQPTPKNEFVNMVTGHWKPLLVCIGLVLVFNVTDYMLLSYMPSYLSANLHYDADHGLFLILIVMVVMLFMQPIVGRLSDKFGRKPVILTGCIASFVLAIPCLMLIQTGSTPLILLGLVIMGLILNTFTGSMPSTLPALFPTAIRYGALAVAFNVSVSLFGGTTPLVTAWLVDASGNLDMPAYYLMLAAIIGAITILSTPETASKPLKGSTPSATDKAEAKELLADYHDNLEEEVEHLDGEIKRLTERRENLIYEHPELYKQQQEEIRQENGNTPS
ncbi:Proline/betaine transporter [Halomonadaceae bacterium LMG 33818]|uniref:glycine betaine/L-proline transporter ProP n=1 Tax=Cernens ardua TaxID=3402176 RepID=UPI003EDBCFDF